MLLFALITVLFVGHAAVATSIDPGHRPSSETRKLVQQVPLSPPVCQYSDGQYWYIDGLYKYDDAADVCAAYGWRLAMLTSSNAFQLADLMSNCAGYGVWVSGVHGLPGDRCALASNGINNSLNGFLGFDTEACEGSLLPVVCEVMPQVVVTETATSVAQTVTSGQTTTTATALHTRTIRRPTGCAKPNSSSHHWNPNYQHKSSPQPFCYGQDCLPVCNATVGGIHLITASVNYRNASLECAKYGWSPLDLTTGRSNDAVSLARACFPFPAFPAHINSYNGVQSACPYTLIRSSGRNKLAVVVFPGNDGMCTSSSDKYVFCQEQCPFDVADSALEVGQVSLTTTTTTITTTAFTPSTTVVIGQSCTETVYRH